MVGSRGNKKRQEKPGYGVTGQRGSLRLILEGFWGKSHLRVCSDSCVSQSLAKGQLGSGWGS